MSSPNPAPPSGVGLTFGLTAYVMWGVMPLYIWALTSVHPIEILAHRIFWSFLALSLLVLAMGRGRLALSYLRDRRTVKYLLISTVLISINWFTFLYAVVTERVLQTSLGYFIGPLVSVALGVLVLGERLRPAQQVALALATAGVAVPLVYGGYFPWIALTLAVAFAVYGLVRKQINVDGLTGNTVETLFMLPIGLCCATFIFRGVEGSSFGSHGVGWDLFLILSGPVTAAPLVFYSMAVRYLRLTTIGFLQYLAPSMSFVLAVLVMGEEFTKEKQICFAFIWAALAIFSWDLYRQKRSEKTTDHTDHTDKTRVMSLSSSV